MNTEIMLPCEPSAIVYTINEDYFACDGCPHEAHANYMPEIGRRGCDTGLHCPLRIREHIVEGFEVSASPDGKWIVSKPGVWGYEGLEEFGGYGGNVYYSQEDAEKALCKLKALHGKLWAALMQRTENSLQCRRTTQRTDPFVQDDRVSLRCHPDRREGSVHSVKRQRSENPTTFRDEPN